MDAIQVVIIVPGGLVGLSGPLPTMWAGLRGWTKAESRGLFQTFNLSILATAMTLHAATGMLNANVGWALLAALPGTMTGAWIGAHTYQRLSEQHVRRAMMVLLALSGVILVGANV